MLTVTVWLHECRKVGVEQNRGMNSSGYSAQTKRNIKDRGKHTISNRCKTATLPIRSNTQLDKPQSDWRGALTPQSLLTLSIH